MTKKQRGDFALIIAVGMAAAPVLYVIYATFEAIYRKDPGLFWSVIVFFAYMGIAGALVRYHVRSRP